MDVWRPANAVDWELLSPDTLFYTTCTGFDSWAVDWLPALSGYPYSEEGPGENRIIGARIVPPNEDPFLFILVRSQRINEADETDEGGDHLRGRVRFLNNTDSYRRPRARPSSKAPKPANGRFRTICGAINIRKTTQRKGYNLFTTPRRYSNPVSGNEVGIHVFRIASIRWGSGIISLEFP